MLKDRAGNIQGTFPGRYFLRLGKGILITRLAGQHREFGFRRNLPHARQVHLRDGGSGVAVDDFEDDFPAGAVSRGGGEQFCAGRRIQFDRQRHVAVVQAEKLLHIIIGRAIELQAV